MDFGKLTISNKTGSTQPLYKTLEGNEIHDVTFKGVDISDVKKKDGSATFRTIKFKFEGAEGATYEHAIFEPTARDTERTVSTFQSKTEGTPIEIENPSSWEQSSLLIKAIIDVVVPATAKKIDAGEITIGGENWDDFRKNIKAMLDPGIGAKTKIKLVKNNQGFATFPGYFASISKEKQLYIRNRFIGTGLKFEDFEVRRMKNAAAAPTKMDSIDLEISNEEVIDDLNFDIGSL